MKINDKGSAIKNDSLKILGNITGNFVSNELSITGNTYGTYGSIIFNYSSSIIGDITGNFIYNHISYTSSYKYGDVNGGVISSNRSSKIGDITGDFINNYISSSKSSNGGAIFNNSYSDIGNITGDFIGNYVAISYGSINGGAICNSFSSNIGNITGDFIGNYASMSASNTPYATVIGGAICNIESEIESITGSFIGNYAFSSSGKTKGGAIYNSKSDIGNIMVDFIGNYVSSSNGAFGGAIYNYRESNNDFITIREGSTFTGNYVTTNNGASKTFEAIYNDGDGILRFNAYVSDKANSIIVNDGINGNSSYKTTQILNINTVPDKGTVTYGTVEFNSFVNNQTVNVKNGTLKLGSFAGATLDVNGASLVVDATTARLNNTNINIAENSTLLISAEVAVNNSATISIDSNAIISFDKTSKLTFDLTSTFVLSDDFKLYINLGDVIGDIDYTFMVFADSANMENIYNELMNNGDIIVYANGSVQDESLWELKDTTSDGNSIYLRYNEQVPEPTTYAIIFGALALGFVAYSKRK